MSNYWKKKLDELNEENAKKSSSTTTKTTKTTKSKDYWGDRLTELENTNKKKKEDEDDIAPVLTPSKKKDDGLDFFQKGAFEDGITVGNIAKSILGTAGDIGVGVVKGASKLAGGVVDAGAYGLAGLSDLMGEDEYAEALRKKTQRNVVDDFFAPVDEKLNKYSMLGRTSDAAMEGLGQVGGIILTGGLGAAGGLGVAGTTALTSGVMGVSSMGSGMSEAYLGGASDEEAATYGLIKGAVDAGSEMLFGGLGKAVKAVGLSRGISSADDWLAQKLSAKITNQLTKNFVQYGVKASGEGLEEVIAGVGSAMAKQATYMSDKELGELMADENLLEQFVVGAVTSGVAQSGLVPGMKSGSLMEANKTGRDFITGNSVNEQKVIDKEFENRISEQEQDGRKLSEKEKSKIYDAVVSDMEKGYISTDTIEEVLGGDIYTAHKETLDAEKAMQEEYDTLYKMKNGEKSDEQIDRQAELKQQLEDIKQNFNRNELRESVMSLVKNDRLAESYNERTRRGQAFEADITKYDSKQQTVIQKAVESGILNNTNRTHEFVDMIAKISADKGVLFDFTNNERLKESGFAVDGKTVNGFVNENGVSLNIDSAKSLNSVVGHEITHVLEGTQLYTELQKVIVDYAKHKGDYKGRMETIQRLYKGQKNANLDAELTADLVGDYLFTDSDFIHNLSTNHRNVFQKIYDEIKYLCKVATAGSKEARELEKVKRAFEKAYQNKNTSQGDAKYSLGYHAGDLGKSESYAMQGKGRSTGHFGFGTYFVGDEAKISGDNTYGNRPHHAVEFDNYNLYKIRNDKDGYELHEQLKVLDGGVSQEFLDAAKEGKFRVSELRTEAYERSDAYDDGDYIGATIRAFHEVAEENGLEVSTYDEWLVEQDPNDYPKPGDSDYDFYRSDYLDYLKETLSTADSEKNSGYEDFNDAYFKLWLRFGKDNVNRALQSVVEHNAAMENSDYDTQRQSDSLATVFMKSLGYEGIDVRGTGLDDTTYGSVIYDLKGVDAKRKAEIGTAKYSLSDSDYLDAVNRGDTDSAQQMVASVARENGYTPVKRYHQTAGGFTEFSTATPRAGLHDSETPNGIFFKDNDHDIGLEGKVQMQAYLKADNMLHFRNREEANKWYCDNVEGYAPLQSEYNSALKPFLDELDEIEKKMFDPATTDDEYSSLDEREEAIIEEMRVVEDSYRERLRELLNGHFLNGTSGYDGIELDYDGHRWVNGKRENVHTYIVFDPAQAKSADPVTYDDSGNVIPLSERFNTEKTDIRYSLSDSEGKPIDSARISDNEFDTRYSLSHNPEIAKGQSDYVLNPDKKSYISEDELKEAQRVTNAMVDVMMKYSSILPEDKIGKVLTKNGSYDRSVENTTICVRTLAYNEFVDKVQEEIGRPLTQMESFLVSQKLYDIAVEPQCLYCYVSLDRKAFNDMLLRYMTDRDTVIAKYNNSDKSPATVEALYEEFLHGRKPTKEMRKRFDAWIGYVDNGTQLLSLADIATEDRQSVIKANGGNLAEQLKDARQYAQSASWSKIQKSYVAYRDEILKLGDKVVKNLNEHYGLRWYSFSDYSAAFIVENMQQITDASIRGLKGLSYTKDTDFAEIFAPSGMNINVSVFVNQDKNGNFFIDEKQSANFEKALELRERYPNVGIVATVTNDDALRWAGEQEWSDVIIPFHIVRTGTDVAEYYKWLNYTAESADTIKDKDIWNSYLDSLNLKSDNARKKVSKNIYPNEHKNDKATYLNLCESRGLSPRFARFAGEDWYMKLVNETRLSADDSTPLKPVYNEDAAKQSFQKFVNKGGYEGGWYKDVINVDAEAKAVAQDVLAGKKANEVSYGRQDGFIPESILAGRKANRTHGKFSLDGDNTRRTFGDYNVYGKDIAMQTEQDIAPVATSKMETTTEDSTAVAKNVASKATYEDIAPMREPIPGQFESLTDEDAPVEMDAPYYGEEAETTVDDPMENRTWEDVGKRNVKAYMYENPEVKPFFQQEAAVMLRELQDSTKGQRLYSDVEYLDSSGTVRQGLWQGQSRHTSNEIAYLLDKGYTYAEIEKGLKAIIEDNGKENNACSKRIEFALNDRLKDGYIDMDGREIPPDDGYVALLNEKQITEYSEEAFDALVAMGEEFVPPVQFDMSGDGTVPPAEPLLPNDKEVGGTTRRNAKGQQRIEPKPKQDNPQTQQRLWNEKTAKILPEEPKKNKNQRGLWSMFKEYVLDNGMIFEDLSLKTGNRELQAKWNFIRNASSMAQTYMGKGKDGTRALNDIRQEVEKSGKTQAFSEYCYHMLNVDRMTLAQRYEGMENKPVFGYHVTAAQSASRAVQLEKANPEFKKWAQELYDINTQLREMLVEGNVLSRETANQWAEMYPHYIPIRRAGYEGAAINVALDTKRTGVNAPIKKATGGNRDILPLFDTMGQRAIQTHRAIAKNRFGLELRKTLGTTISEETAGMDSVIDSMDNEEGLLTKGDKNNAPTFTVFENGKRYTFEITDEMYESMKPTSDLLAYTNPVLNKANNAFRGLLTEYNPVFMLGNAVKDAQDILINSQHPARTYMSMPKAIGQMMSGGNYYREYMENGGEQNTYFDSQTDTFDTKDTLGKKLLGIPPLKLISWANNAIERLPRMAEYIASREDGRSIEVSMLDAARVTTNFAAGGKLTKFANRNGATFLNASVQGAVQQARNLREAKANGLKGVIGLAAKVAMAGLPAMLVNHLLWDDDEDYEELSDYVKQDYYIVAKTQDGQFVRIPKGRTLAVIQNAFEQMENLITGDDEVDLGAFLELAVSNLAPNNPLENNILAPIKQVAENKTWYGEDLVPTRLQDLPKEEQFDESTDALSKWLGEKQSFLSPYQINYLLDQYSGGVGDVFLPMWTPEAESGDNSLMGNIVAPFKKKFVTDAVMNNQNVSDFYDTKDELTTNAKRRGATDEDVLKSKYFNSINSELSDLYAQKREIQNGTLPDDAKYEAVRNIQSQIVELTREALNDYPNVSISGDYAAIGNRQYRRNEDGEWVKVTDKQAEKQDKVMGGLDISASEYWRNKEEYDFAYEKPEKYAVAKSVGGYAAYKDYNKQLNDIKGEDLDGDGRSDPGTRKEKVLDWVNGLDADYGTKIILFKSVYNADDTYNYEIIEYLNSRSDISGEEMEAILKELDFEVDKNGNISW